MGYCLGRKQGCMEAAPTFLTCSDSLLPWGILADSQTAADRALFAQVLAAHTRAEQWQAKQPPHFRVRPPPQHTTPKKTKNPTKRKTPTKKPPLCNFYSYPAFSLKITCSARVCMWSSSLSLVLLQKKALLRCSKQKSVTILHCFHLTVIHKHKARTGWWN